MLKIEEWDMNLVLDNMDYLLLMRRFELKE